MQCWKILHFSILGLSGIVLIAEDSGQNPWPVNSVEEDPVFITPDPVPTQESSSLEEIEKRSLQILEERGGEPEAVPAMESLQKRQDALSRIDELVSQLRASRLEEESAGMLANALPLDDSVVPEPEPEPAVESAEVTATGQEPPEPISGDVMTSGRIQNAVTGRRIREPETDEAVINTHGAEGRKSWQEVRNIDKASFYHSQGEYRLAERTFVEVLESTAPNYEKIRALEELAEVYVDMGRLTMAVDTLENLLRRFPEIEHKPEVYYRLGGLYRQMGLMEESIGMYYRVLNAIVVTGDSSLNKFLGVARKAQFEIARSHYDEGEFEQAFLLFNRINLLELGSTDRETVLYYKVLASLKAGHHQQGLNFIRRFIGDYPQSEYVHEMLYLEAQVLYQLNRKEASGQSLLRLLRESGLPGEDATGERMYWRQEAGNELANRFFKDGEFLVALRIYQGMVQLSEDPEWQLPVLYQVGICFEKLAMFDRAEQTYRYIEQELVQLETVPAQTLEKLKESVQWRMQVLEWRKEVGAELEDLVEQPESIASSQNPF